MTLLYSHLAILAPASSSWLSLLPACSSSSSSNNRQIVPRLPLCTVIAHQHTQPLSAAATAATLARPVPVLAPTTPAAAPQHTSFTAAEPDELSPTRARLYALYEFVSAHGRLPSVQDSHQGVAVGQWAEKCRQLQQQQGLEPQLASALQSIPGWTWDLQISTLSDGFQANLQQMAAYAQRYGEPPPQRSLRRSSSRSSSSRSAGAPSDAEREAAVAITKQVGLMARGTWLRGAACVGSGCWALELCSSNSNRLRPAVRPQSAADCTVVAALGFVQVNDLGEGSHPNYSPAQTPIGSHNRAGQ